jgi:hypothetical protein
MLRDVPHEPHELAASRVGEAAIVTRTSDEWFGVEREWRHTLAWSPWRGWVDFETWPRNTWTLNVEASVTSREPIVLTVLQDGAVLWRSTIFPGFSRPMKLAVSCLVRSGRAHLEFLAGRIGQLEPPEGAGRSPIFSIGDLRFTAVQSVAQTPTLNR